MKHTSLLLVLIVLFNFSNNAQTTVSDADGNQYNIVTIGTQKWTKENLKTTKYSDGTGVALVTDNTAWSNLTTAAYCQYPSYANVYGNLYNFYAVANPKNLCPIGWHVATYDEWIALTTYLGGPNDAASKLKETGTTHWGVPNTDATNVSGFTAFGGGYRKFDGVFYNILDDGYFWHGTETGTSYAWYSNMDPSSGYLYINDNDKKDGMSVRCIKDASSGIDNSDNQLFNIYPNPAKDHITIDFGKYTNLNGYTLKITNSLGATVFSAPVNQQSSSIALNGWKGKGIYFVHLIDKQSCTIEIRKIVIQ